MRTQLYRSTNAIVCLLMLVTAGCMATATEPTAGALEDDSEAFLGSGFSPILGAAVNKALRDSQVVQSLADDLAELGLQVVEQNAKPIAIGDNLSVVALPALDRNETGHSGVIIASVRKGNGEYGGNANNWSVSAATATYAEVDSASVNAVSQQVRDLLQDVRFSRVSEVLDEAIALGPMIQEALTLDAFEVWSRSPEEGDARMLASLDDVPASQFALAPAGAAPSIDSLRELDLSGLYHPHSDPWLVDVLALGGVIFVGYLTYLVVAAALAAATTLAAMVIIVALAVGVVYGLVRLAGCFLLDLQGVRDCEAELGVDPWGVTFGI